MIFRTALGLTFATLAIVPAVASDTAVDPQQRYKPWIIGEAPPAPDIRFSTGVVSKYVDQGNVLNDDATAVFDLNGRLYGFGAQLTGGVALGGDSRGLYDTAFPDLVAINLKVDYLARLDWAKNIPLLTINPYFEYITYPVQPKRDSDGKLNRGKVMQRWLGVDSWIAPPYKGWEGLEFGGGLAMGVAPDSADFRGAFGARQFIQADGFDFFASQMLNFGNEHYRRDIVGGDPTHTGFTTFALKAELRMALPYKEWFMKAGAGVAWWLDANDRNAIGTKDSAIVTLSMGVEWIPGN